MPKRWAQARIQEKLRAVNPVLANRRNSDPVRKLNKIPCFSKQKITFAFL
ncbi:hypothetical protein K7419_001557 [Morganella morganii]|nr:hypothetical protein [Morganella morganii]